MSLRSASRLRALLVAPSGGDIYRPALWRVEPGQVDVVSLVQTPDSPVRPESIGCLSRVEEVLREINWGLRLMRIAKGYRFCADVDLSSVRITAAVSRRGKRRSA